MRKKYFQCSGFRILRLQTLTTKNKTLRTLPFIALFRHYSPDIHAK